MAFVVKTTIRPPAGVSRRPRSRFGYDHRWWGETPRPEPEGMDSYWSRARKPLPCLFFILPMLATYEFGVAWLGGPSADSLRTGADAWIRQALAAFGQGDRWFLPLSLILTLVGWQAATSRDWRFGPSCLLGMAVESVVLAVGLIGMSKLIDLGFERLEPSHETLAAGGPLGSKHSLAMLVGFLGAGIYEEALFRLALIPLLYGSARFLHANKVLATVLAVTGSSLAFSIAHHAGSPGEVFTWYAFIFRWAAGVYFAWVFVARGFGIAVGTHAAYDILVGWLGWHW